MPPERMSAGVAPRELRALVEGVASAGGHNGAASVTLTLNGAFRTLAVVEADEREVVVAYGDARRRVPWASVREIWHRPRRKHHAGLLWRRDA